MIDQHNRVSVVLKVINITLLVIIKSMMNFFSSGWKVKCFSKLRNLQDVLELELAVILVSSTILVRCYNCIVLVSLLTKLESAINNSPLNL